MTDQSWHELSQETHDIWEQNAGFWDDYMGDGNPFHKTLVAPAVERLLQLQPGEQILDVGCGNGNFARQLAGLGAQVLACDFSETFIARAQARTTTYTDRLDYRVVDATDYDQLIALGRQRFDAAVCLMALMDMATIDPLLKALRELLKPQGRFIFALSHPCFNSSQFRKVVEEEDIGGTLVTQYALKILGYITPIKYKGLGVIGQPAPHYYFHRPLHLLLNHCFEAGFVLDGLEEPVFNLEAKAQRPFAWDNYKEIPPVLAARLRLLP